MKLRIGITGSHGLIGAAVVETLRADGQEVLPLPRPTEKIELPGLDAVVHLAGENIAGRWTVKKKVRIRDSRVTGTRLLSEALAQSERAPRCFVCASAIGYYGDRGTEPLTDDSPPGRGFLAGVCREWERATAPASAAGIRVVNLRFGVVLSADGGALAKLLLPFRLGLGGVMGNGRQFWSWVSIDDAVGAIRQAIQCDGLRGPVNVVAPTPVTNREFTRTLGRVLGRPTILPMPALAARAAFGEMAEAALLASAYVQPIRLEGSGYRFQHRDLEEALRSILSPARAGGR